MSFTEVVAIDPGTRESAILRFDGERVWFPRIDDNRKLLADYGGVHTKRSTVFAIERFMPYGQRLDVGSLETVWWSGRFYEDLRGDNTILRVPRRDVKSHLLGRASGKDANDAAIRSALVDRFGGIDGKKKAVGTKAEPGPLYGVKKDLWAALAVAVTVWDARSDGEKLDEWARID